MMSGDSCLCNVSSLYSLTHTLTHTGTARGGHGSSERTTTSGFSLKKGKKSLRGNGKYRF